MRDLTANHQFIGNKDLFLYTKSGVEDFINKKEGMYGEVYFTPSNILYMVYFLYTKLVIINWHVIILTLTIYLMRIFIYYIFLSFLFLNIIFELSSV